MPVEFSVAAYRFGHSMVRSQYQLNEKIKERPIFSDDTADLGGFRPIPTKWAIDWQFFIDLDHSADQIPGKPQLSYKIDTSLVHPLGHLPSRIAKGSIEPGAAEPRARRDLPAAFWAERGHGTRFVTNSRQGSGDRKGG